MTVPELIEGLKKMARREPWADDAVYDNSGGNYDDAYAGGIDDGQTYLAREILKGLNIEY